jgi:hypothetical protein
MDELAGCTRRQRATQSKFGLIASLNRLGVEVKDVTLLKIKQSLTLLAGEADQTPTVRTQHVLVVHRLLLHCS